MSRKKRQFADDDGRTIADMREVAPAPRMFPRRREGGNPSEPAHVGAEQPWESSALSKEERRAAMAGAMGAAMLLAGVFIAAGALAILAMQLLWN